MEKAIKDANVELSTLSENLKSAQSEIHIKDEKIQSLMKQLDAKALELVSNATANLCIKRSFYRPIFNLGYY